MEQHGSHNPMVSEQQGRTGGHCQQCQLLDTAGWRASTAMPATRYSGVAGIASNASYSIQRGGGHCQQCPLLDTAGWRALPAMPATRYSGVAGIIVREHVA